jgi:hypothetical protein
LDGTEDAGMSFAGLLDTVGPADVLTLLAATAKTGELQLTGPDGCGQLWLKDGRLVASDDGHGSRHPEAVFHLVGLTSGTFSFEEGREASEPGRPFEVGPLLVAAAERRREWEEIRAVIPSDQAVACMAPAAAHGHVIISALQWSILVATAGGSSVGDLIRAVRQPEFEGARLLKEMVEARLIDVTEPLIRVEPTPRRHPTGGPHPVDPGRSAAPVVTAPTTSSPAPTPDPVAAMPRAADTPTLASAGYRPTLDEPRPPIGPVVDLSVDASGPACLPVAAGAPPVTVEQVERRPGPPTLAAGEPAEPAEPPDQPPTGRNWMADLAMSEALSAADPAAHSSGGAPAPRPDGSEPVLADDDTSEADAESQEPINRGLLLKFLSSVRS